MNSDFNINDYYFKQEEHRLPIDNTFWAEIGELKDMGIIIPKKRPKLGWPKMLQESFGITEHVYYDPEIVGLPLTLTKEQIEEVRVKINKYVVKSLKDPTPVRPPVSIDAEQALEALKMGLLGERSANEFLEMMGKKVMPIIHNDWQKKVLSWRRGYGFLVPHNKMKGWFMPVPAGDESLKYEVVREYFFHIKPNMFLDSYFSGIVLSLAQEPNSDKAIFGFRRDFATDWVFGDSRFFDGEIAMVGGMYVDGAVQGGRAVNVKPFVEEVNYLVGNLEDILSQ